MTHCNVSRFKALMVGLSTNCKGVWGPPVICKRAPDKSGNTKAWYFAWLKSVWRKKLIKIKRRKLR